MKKLLLLMLFITGACFAAPEIPVGATSYLPLNGNLTDLLGTVWTGSPSFAPGKFGEALVKNMPASNLSYEQFSTTGVGAFDVGWEDFTYEFWIGIDTSLLSYTTGRRLASLYLQESAKSHGLELMFGTIDPANNRYILQLKAWDGDLYNASAFSAYATNTAGIEWYHICFERKNTGSALTMYFYVNGHLIGAGTMNTPVAPLEDVSFYLSGTDAASTTVYIDDFVFSKGIAKYGGVDFTPPGFYRNKYLGLSLGKVDESQPPDGNTKALLHFDNNLNDIASNTWAGSPSYAAGVFDEAIVQVMPAGTTGYPQASLSSAKTPFEVGWSPFTCEFWLGINTEMLSYTTSQRIFSFNIQSTGPQVHEWAVYMSTIDPANNRYQLALSAGSSGLYNLWHYTGYITDIDGIQWYHVAFERQADSSLHMYLNGTELAVDGTGTINDLSGIQYVALSTYASLAASNTVYIDEFRFSNVARFQGSFTPSNVPYKTYLDNKLKFSEKQMLTTRMPDDNTLAMFHFDTSETEALSDTEFSLTKDAYADVIITTGGKFDNCLYDGAGTSPDGWLVKANATAPFEIGTGDYCVEWWLNTGSLSVNSGSNSNLFYIFANNIGGDTPDYLFCNLFAYYNLGTFNTEWGCNPSFNGDQLAMFALPSDNTWHHFCVERYSGVVTFYVDGVIQDTSTGNMATANIAGFNEFGIGRYSAALTSGNWKIDEVKISNVARYMGAFTPPTAPSYYIGNNVINFSQ